MIVQGGWGQVRRRSAALHVSSRGRARTQAILAAPAAVQTETPRITGWLEHMATEEAKAMQVTTLNVK